MKIKTKLTILFLLLSLVPFFTGGIISFYNGRKALRDGIGRKLLESARNAMNKIDQNINNEIHDIEHWISSPIMNEALISNNNKNTISLLRSIIQAHPGYLHLDCINTKGEITASSNLELLNKKIEIDTDIKKALAGQISVSESHKDDSHKEKVISFYVPISTHSNEANVIGILAAHLKLKEIQDAVNEIKIGEGEYSVDEHIMLIDKNGLIIYAPPIAEELGHVLNLNLLEMGMQSAKLAVDGEEGYLIEINEHDKNALIGYAHSKGYKNFPGLGWSILVMQSPDLAFKPIVSLRNKIILLGMFTSIGIIFLSLLISSRICAPLKSLVLSSTMIADGDLSQRVELTSDDEIGELIKSFNKMAEALESREKKLIAIQNELDEKNQKLRNINNELSENNKYLEYIIQEIHRLLESVVEQKSFKVRFQNIDLGKCWEIKKCDSTECPSYKSEDQRCWHVKGTICHGEIQGNLAQKLADCQKCEVYQKAVMTKLYAIGEGFNNMMDLLEDSHRQLQDYADNLENKVKERTYALEKAYKDLKDTQLQLIQSGKLAAIGQLAAGISHELNNPLGGIMGYSQLILEKIKAKGGSDNLASEDLQSIFTYAGYIEKESKKCKDIVANLLAFSRKSKDTEFNYLDINKLLEDTLLFTKNQLEINKVKINKKLAQDVPNILGNAHQIQQVFTNLIVNAQQAMKQGGILTITTKLLNKSVEISFSDTGEGVSEENMGKLFTPFFTTKEPGKGTGLGLSVSYGIIKNHKGEIKVESKVGKGSIFYVIFPIAPIVG